MNITSNTVLITGANRGIGRALVDEAIRRGAKRVYAGTRSGLQHADKRVTPLTLDVTDASQIERATSVAARAWCWWDLPHVLDARGQPMRAARRRLD